MPDAGGYTTGPAHPQRQDYATFEYKSSGPDSTGGGYPRWRSWEHRPHTSRRGKEDVFVTVHRLAAVAWLFPDEWTAADVLASERLVGADVHHELGAPSANCEAHLALVEHGTHSEITQAQMRAWGEDRKHQARETHPEADADTCGRCGDPADVLCESPDWDGRRCVPCSQIDSDDAPIEVV